MPKLILPENIAKLKEQLDTENNLVDYFFICGIPPSLCTNELLYKVSSSEKNSEELKDLLKPKILCKFPEFEKTTCGVDEEIISYCFPEGFDIIYSSSSRPERKIFSIILDNGMKSQDYPQKYLTCILFYEKLYQYKKLQQQIEKIENDKEVDLDNEEDNITNMRSNLQEEKNMNIYRHKKLESSILPSFSLKKSMRINEEDLKDIMKEVPNLNKKTKEKENYIQPMNKLNYYYVPKCICLLSVHRRIKLFQKILLHIYNYGLAQNNNIPLEKIITNLIIEVPFPPRGLYSINYNYNFDIIEKNGDDEIDNKKNQEIMRATTLFKKSEQNTVMDYSVLPLLSTGNNKILISENDLNKFNSYLSFKCKMEVIKHMIFGSKILFFSQNLTKLTDIISSFLSIIFPFDYPFQVISFLQKNQYPILNSPSIFMMGLNQEFDKSIFEENEITLESVNFFLVDLDSNEEENYELISDEEFPQFPNKLLTNLEKEIKALETAYKDKKREIEIGGNIYREKIIKEFNEKYQEKFFIFFCEILRGYEEYLNRDFFNDDFVSIKTLFNCEKFIKSSNHYQSDYDFYTKFVEDSQLFSNFIIKNMTPKNNNVLMDILIVNNYLNSQKKKKTKTEEPDVYAITNKYIVPRPKEITNEEKDILIKQRLDLSKNGQVIKKIKIKEVSDIKFDYPLFPLLDFNIYCNNNNVNQYIYAPDYREEIEVLNMDSISKSSLGKNINRAMEMKNYLYLTWLEIWAYTFGNNDFGEKHYRFDQMMDVLDKVIHHEMNILNLMFDILYKYDEKDMMLKLYQKLLRLNLNPSTTIYDTMIHTIDKDKMKDLIDINKKKKTNLKELKYNDYNKKNNRERTFLSINDNLPLETKPKFYFNYSCITCGTIINLYLISKNFEGVRNDILWVKCPKLDCQEYNLPKITVKFGLSFINDKSNSTSIKEYVLHSPYNLKINIKQAVNTHFRYMNKNEKLKLKISNFKAEFQPLFWDFIWYCIIHDLDYNILLPYSKTLEEEKKAHCYNPNINIFEVNYDDSTFKANQNKIEKISNNIIKQNSAEKAENKKFKNLTKCKEINIEIKKEIKEEKKNIIKTEENKIENKSKDNKEKKEINSGQNNKGGMFELFDTNKKKIEYLKKETKDEKKKEEEEEEEDEEEEEEGDDDEEEDNKK